LNCIVELSAAAFDLLFAQPIDRHVHDDAINPGVKG
jgi:hypothetical protein